MNGKMENLWFKKGVNSVRFGCFVLYVIVNFGLLFVLGGCGTKINIEDTVPPGDTTDPKVV